MKRMNFPGRKEQRRKEAEERTMAFRNLSVEEQLERNSTKFARKTA